jgi:hypothetical protein
LRREERQKLSKFRLYRDKNTTDADLGHKNGRYLCQLILFIDESLYHVFFYL